MDAREPCERAGQNDQIGGACASGVGTRGGLEIARREFESFAVREGVRRVRARRACDRHVRMLPSGRTVTPPAPKEMRATPGGRSRVGHQVRQRRSAFRHRLLHRRGCAVRCPFEPVTAALRVERHVLSEQQPPEPSRCGRGHHGHAEEGGEHLARRAQPLAGRTTQGG